MKYIILFSAMSGWIQEQMRLYFPKLYSDSIVFSKQKLNLNNLTKIKTLYDLSLRAKSFPLYSRSGICQLQPDNADRDQRSIGRATSYRQGSYSLIYNLLCI